MEKEPVMEHDLEPGLAWMVMETEEGGTKRIHEGKFSSLVLILDWVDPADLAFDFPFFAGAIFSFTFSARIEGVLWWPRSSKAAHAQIG